MIQPQVERVYSSYLQLNLEEVEPCISGPKRYAFYITAITITPG